MSRQFGDPGRIPFVRLFAWAAAQLVRMANVHLDRPNEHMIDGLPIDTSRNLAKRILEWEYGIEIERTRLLLRTEEQRHPTSDDPVSSHEGTCPQGAGVAYGPAVLSASPASGGHRHVCTTPSARRRPPGRLSLAGSVAPETPDGEAGVPGSSSYPATPKR
jgi:hypothetical protein